MSLRSSRTVSPPARRAMARRNCSAVSWFAALTSSLVVLMVPSSRISIFSWSICMTSAPSSHHGLTVSCRIGFPLQLPAELSGLTLYNLLRVGALDIVHVPCVGQFEPSCLHCVGTRAVVLREAKARPGVLDQEAASL